MAEMEKAITLRGASISRKKNHRTRKAFAIARHSAFRCGIKPDPLRPLVAAISWRDEL
jgi:hypothetical protein